MTRPAFDLVIFDCDGVLVDSEMLSAKVLTEQLAGLGIDLSFADFQKYFLGRKFSVAVAELKARTQNLLPDTFQERYFERLLDLFETDLQPIPGIAALLRAMHVNFCVASSSLPPRLNCALRVCDLQQYFGNHVYSTALVKNAKPAPDLFLHAAQVEGFSPARCLVIEDSDMGIQAARAAGMEVWHFTGGAHLTGVHAAPSAVGASRVVKDMITLQNMFHLNGLSRGHSWVNDGVKNHGA